MIRTMPWGRSATSGPEPLITREWLVTNGLGGYASGTVSGVASRRYHGILVAALPAPLGRVMVLNRLAERVRLSDGTSARLGGEERRGALDVPSAGSLEEFRLEDGLPVWRYRVGSVLLEKRIDLPHLQNTAHVTYRIIEGRGPVHMRLQPAMNVRPHDSPVDSPLKEPYVFKMAGDRFEIHPGGDCPLLKLYFWGQKATMVLGAVTIKDLFYRLEAARGYPETGDLWSPGYFRVSLREDAPATLSASIEPWPTLLALPPDRAFAAENERRRRLIEMADPRATPDRPPSSSWPPTSS